jgi:SAM-dependent methyltransferase
MFAVDNGWQISAGAWIADMGDRGDFGRRYVLDPVMVPRALGRSPGKALDVGCGEGRFCRMLKPHGVDVVGVDPTPALLAAARARDTKGVYLEAPAERLLGLILTYFDEPAPSAGTPSSRAAGYSRVPWFVVMEWLKPDSR